MTILAVTTRAKLNAESKLGAMTKKVHHPGTQERDGIVQGLSRVLARDSRIVFAYLFGSCAESLPFHDIDVGVFLRDPGTLSDVALALAHQLSSRLNLRVDVRVVNGAPTSLVYHVLRGELLISHDDELLSSLIENTTRHYLDIAPLRRRATKEAFAP